jgi:hypothetical protein
LYSNEKAIIYKVIASEIEIVIFDTIFNLCIIVTRQPNLILIDIWGNLKKETVQDWK